MIADSNIERWRTYFDGLANSGARAVQVINQALASQLQAELDALLPGVAQAEQAAQRDFQEAEQARGALAQQAPMIGATPRERASARYEYEEAVALAERVLAEARATLDGARAQAKNARRQLLLGQLIPDAIRACDEADPALRTRIEEAPKAERAQLVAQWQQEQSQRLSRVRFLRQAGEALGLAGQVESWTPAERVAQSERY